MRTPNQTMPVLCPNGGRLPEKYRPFLSEDGSTIQAGDAFGLEAQWVLSQVTFADDYYPEMEWSKQEIARDAESVGCVRCGDEEVATVYGLCETCEEL